MLAAGTALAHGSSAGSTHIRPRAAFGRAASAKLPRLFTCTSPVALAQLQREIYLDTMDGLFVSGTTLLQLWGQVAQDAVRPVAGNGRAHTTNPAVQGASGPAITAPAGGIRLRDQRIASSAARTLA